MDKVSDEEFAELEMEVDADRRHEELVTVLEKIVTAPNFTGIEKCLDRQSAVLASLEKKDFSEISKAIAETANILKTLYKPEPARVVFEVVRDQNGFITQVIKTTQEKK